MGMQWVNKKETNIRCISVEPKKRSIKSDKVSLFFFFLDAQNTVFKEKYLGQILFCCENHKQAEAN